VQEIVGAARDGGVADSRAVLDGEDDDEALGGLRQAVERGEPRGVGKVEVGDDQVVGAGGDRLERRLQRARGLDDDRARSRGEVGPDDLGCRRGVLDQQDARRPIRRETRLAARSVQFSP